MSEKNSDLVLGLLIGGLIGAAFGILFAPKSGKEMREDIFRTGGKGKELFSMTKETFDKAVEKGIGTKGNELFSITKEEFDKAVKK
jgi:gas vesicle protein